MTREVTAVLCSSTSPDLLPRQWFKVTFAQVRCGGDERTRTVNPLLAKQVRYQLRHVPGGAG